MTREQHDQAGRTLTDLRGQMATVTRRLGGRVPASVLDAALGVERQLATLTLRLADAAHDAFGAGAAGLYQLDAPPPEAGAAPPRPPPRWLAPDEHRAVGAELYRLRGRVQSLTVVLGDHVPKSSSAGRVLLKPERAIDRLRCRLDGLMYRQHPGAFSTRVYYPGRTWDGGSSAGPAGPAGAPGVADADPADGRAASAGHRATAFAL